MRVLALAAAGILFFVMVVVSACSADVQPTQIAAVDLTATALCAVTPVGDYVLMYELYGTPTPNPELINQAAVATSQALDTASVGDVIRGQVVFHAAGCSACHKIDSEETFVGPSLKTIANRAAYKRPGLDGAAYLRAVIMNPDTYIMPLTKPGIMPRTYAQSLTVEQINDVVAYLLTLNL